MSAVRVMGVREAPPETLTYIITHDRAGNVLTITLPSGRVITYTRNANGQVSWVSAEVNSTATLSGTTGLARIDIIR